MRKENGVSNTSSTSWRLTVSANDRIDQGDERRDAKPGAGEVRIEPSERLDEPRVEPNFFVSLPQRRRARRLSRIDLAAGKGDLAGMGAQVRGPKGQKDAQALRPIDNGQKHRGRTGQREHIRPRRRPGQDEVADPGRAGFQGLDS